MQVRKFAEGLADGIEEMRDVIKSYIDDPDKLLESGETIANTVLTHATLPFEEKIAAAASAALLIDMTMTRWNPRRKIYSKAIKFPAILSSMI